MYQEWKAVYALDLCWRKGEKRMWWIVWKLQGLNTNSHCCQEEGCGTSWMFTRDIDICLWGERNFRCFRKIHSHGKHLIFVKTFKSISLEEYNLSGLSFSKGLNNISLESLLNHSGRRIDTLTRCLLTWVYPMGFQHVVLKFSLVLSILMKSLTVL